MSARPLLGWGAFKMMNEVVGFSVQHIQPGDEAETTLMMDLIHALLSWILTPSPYLCVCLLG